MKKSLLFLVVSLGTIGFASAQVLFFTTGQKLMDGYLVYEKVKDGVAVTATEALLDGVFFGYTESVADYGASARILSLPDDVSVAQLCAIVGRYIEEHPELWNQPGWFLALSALRDAFPGPTRMPKL